MMSKSVIFTCVLIFLQINGYPHNKNGHKSKSHHLKHYLQNRAVTLPMEALPTGGTWVKPAEAGYTEGPDVATMGPVPTQPPGLMEVTDSQGRTTLIQYPGTLSAEISGGEGGEAEGGEAGSLDNTNNFFAGGVANASGGKGVNNGTGGFGNATGGDIEGELLGGGEGSGGEGGNINIGDNVDNAKLNLYGSYGGQGVGGAGGKAGDLTDGSFAGIGYAEGGIGNGTGSVGGLGTGKGGDINATILTGGQGVGGTGGTMNIQNKPGYRPTGLIQGGGGNGGLGQGGDAGYINEMSNATLGGNGQGIGGSGEEEGTGGEGKGQGGEFYGLIGTGGTGYGADGGTFNVDLGPETRSFRQYRMHDNSPEAVAFRLSLHTGENPMFETRMLQGKRHHGKHHKSKHGHHKNKHHHSKKHHSKNHNNKKHHSKNHNNKNHHNKKHHTKNHHKSKTHHQGKKDF